MFDERDAKVCLEIIKENGSPMPVKALLAAFKEKEGARVEFYDTTKFKNGLFDAQKFFIYRKDGEDDFTVDCYVKSGKKSKSVRVSASLEFISLNLICRPY